MPAEGYKGPIPPEYDLAVYDDEAIISILAKIVRAKRDFAAAAKPITDALGHSVERMNMELRLNPHIDDALHTTGLSDALDILAPLRSGRRWNNVANEIADNHDIVFAPQTTLTNSTTESEPPYPELTA